MCPAPIRGFVGGFGQHDLTVLELLHQHPFHVARVDTALYVQNDFSHTVSPPFFQRRYSYRILLYGYLTVLSLAFVPVTVRAGAVLSPKYRAETKKSPETDPIP